MTWRSSSSSAAASSTMRWATGSPSRAALSTWGASDATCAGVEPAPAAPTTAQIAGSETRASVAARPATSKITAADRSAPPGRIAEPGPSARASTRPCASPIATLVCDPPESTPSKTTEGRTDGRAPGSDGIDVPSFRRSVGACDHRTSNPNRDRYASSQRHIPRPRQAGKPAQWEMRKDGSQDDRGHDQDAHDQGDDDIALPRSRPCAAQDVRTKERAIGQRRDAERELDDRCVLIAKRDSARNEDRGPHQREPASDP